jgi:hypothetical protein
MVHLGFAQPQPMTSMLAPLKTYRVERNSRPAVPRSRIPDCRQTFPYRIMEGLPVIACDQRQMPSTFSFSGPITVER